MRYTDTVAAAAVLLLLLTAAARLTDWRGDASDAASPADGPMGERKPTRRPAVSVSTVCWQ